jgi:hypothetical protein
VEKGSIHPVVRSIAPDHTNSNIPAAPIYYLAPTPAQQSVEVSRRLCHQNPCARAAGSSTPCRGDAINFEAPSTASPCPLHPRTLTLFLLATWARHRVVVVVGGVQLTFILAYQVTEVPVTHYYGGRPVEHLRAIQPAPPPQPFPQYVTAQHPWGAPGWTNAATGAPATVIHHPYPSAPVASPGTVHFVSLSHDGRHITHQW